MAVWRRLVVIVVLAWPAAFYFGLPLRWQARGVSPLQGDEPHYLITADAVVVDHRVTVGAAYARDSERRVLYGPVDWWNHSYTGEHGTFSIHGIGVSLLVAPFYAAFGVAGARALVAAIASLVPILFFLIARRAGIGARTALVLAVSASFGLPFLAASGQVYPDLLTGVLVLALACVALAAARSRVGVPTLALAGVLLGLLPWLHAKNVAPMSVLVLAIPCLDLQAGRWRLHAGRIAWLAALPLASLALLAWYNAYAFGSVLGPLTAGKAAGATVRQAGMIFLGLHFDQSQGIFLQQPLFLLAVPGVAVMVRREPGFALALAALYLSILVPNAFHDCWYGCYSFTGRFMWSVAALWFFPLTFLYLGLRDSRPVRALLLACAGGSVAWQIALMSGWWQRGPASMYRVLRADVVQRDHVFYRHGWSILPSFYDFGHYLSYGPNLVSLVFALALIGAGIAVAARLPGGRALPAAEAAVPAASSIPQTGARSRHRWRRTATVIVLAAIAAIGASILGARIARPRDVLLVDLMQRLDDADQERRGGFGVSTETIAGDARRAIGAQPPARVAWTVSVPPHSWLRTAMGIDERAWLGKGVRFGIAIRDGAYTRQVVSKPMVPRMFRGDRRWVPVAVDLSEYAGRTIQVVFTTEANRPESGDPHADAAYWAAPAIHLSRGAVAPVRPD